MSAQLRYERPARPVRNGGTPQEPASQPQTEWLDVRIAQNGWQFWQRLAGAAIAKALSSKGLGMAEVWLMPFSRY